jgi:hypothetical protein
VLRSAEAELFVAAIGSVYDELDMLSSDEYPFLSNVPIFDRLQRPQQLALLLEVAEALLLDHVPPPALTAVREAVVGVLLARLQAEVIAEIDAQLADDSSSCYWRTLVRRACLETDVADSDVPPPASEDIGQWDLLIDSLGDGLLWDRDWEMEADFVDRHPDQIAAIKSLMRISDEYFTDIAPDPTRQELANIRKRLNELTGLSHPETP